MTRAEFEQRCRELCSYCAGGQKPRYRPETREYVHDYRSQASFSITLCRANQFRNEHTDKELE